MSLDLLSIIKNIYYIILFVISIFCVYNFKFFSKNYKYLAALIVVSSAVEIFVALYNTFYLSHNTFYAYHFLLPFSMTLTYFTFKPYWNNSTQKVLGIVTFIFVILSFLNSFLNQEFANFPSNGLVLLCILSDLFSLITLKQIIESKADVPLSKKPIFWVSISILIYYTFSYLNFSFYIIYNSISLIYTLLYIAFRIILYSFYIALTYALYLNKKQTLENRN